MHSPFFRPSAYPVNVNALALLAAVGAVAGAHAQATPVRAAMVSSAYKDGLFLIGGGALLVAGAYVYQGVGRGLTGQRVGPIGGRADRLLYSCDAL
jgi:hypothetical protein